MEISIEKIKCDIRGRTNKDVTELYNSLMTYGQLDPILVEGPDKNGDYYLIHGYRRFLALSNEMNKFKKVKCTVNSEVTSTERRNALRLILISNGKKTTGLDEQLVYEELENFTDREYLFPKNKKRRMKKGNEVPQDIRIEYEKKRRSQDALALIYGLEEMGSYKDNLLRCLKNGEITTIHGDAIKRIVNHPMYNHLDKKQKIGVIEKARKSAKFTENEAGFIIFEQIMKNSPQKENLNNWIEYICDEIERVSELIHKDLEYMSSDLHKRKLKKSIDQLNDKLNWVCGQNSESKSNNQIRAVKIKTKPEKPQKNKASKHVIVTEKRDGNKLTFYFS
ncbi:ParB N-terminal domain-containing protein [Peribacillus saganii]|uniref:ParB N-terminal domain-containing protein n=1 Tax=Peribacillus saganii TaxID=2303992 RepID=UPI0013146279|nr:ParB N-terminal domain-containing protein [Peribacillus saganii]